MHWTLAVVRPARRVIELYDSLRVSDTKAEFVCRVLNQYLSSEHADKKGEPLPGAPWPLHVVIGRGPKLQLDGSACGVFAVIMAAMLSAGKRAPFAGLSHARVPELRARIAADCLSNKHTPL